MGCLRSRCDPGVGSDPWRAANGRCGRWARGRQWNGMPVHLTDRFVASIRTMKRANVADDVVPGLRLRISPSGAKSWAVYYRLRESQHERMFTLGRYPELSLGRAREAARKVLARAGLGEDPQANLLQAREQTRAKEV